MNANTVTVASAGLIAGTTMENKMRNSEAPSSRALSISGSGSCETNCLMRKKYMGVASAGTINAQYVFSMPVRATII